MLPQVANGTVEGGDISVFRDGLVLIGCSGERTDEAGAQAVADLFERQGWRAIIYRFDPHFLHLDTQFSALSCDQALACVDVLEDRFLSDLAGEESHLTYPQMAQMAAHNSALCVLDLLAILSEMDAAAARP